MRHIVVEGADGSGKSNLVRDLVAALGLPIHPRSTPSVGGPPANLDQWVEREFRRPKVQGIYDRHALVSEPIYGPIIRGAMPGMFNDKTWLETCRGRLAHQSVFVFCIPPYMNVADNVLDGDLSHHMAGVAEPDNLYAIYQAYAMTAKQFESRKYHVLIHDYTVNAPGSENRGTLISRIRAMARR